MHLEGLEDGSLSSVQVQGRLQCAATFWVAQRKIHATKFDDSSAKFKQVRNPADEASSGKTLTQSSQPRNEAREVVRVLFARSKFKFNL